ncbi:hypothetical protein D3C72_1967170 [compost metagenome]
MLLLCIGARARQLVPGDQALGQRPAQQAANDEAESGAGNAQGRGAAQSILLLQYRAPGASRTVAAQQRDGAGHEANQRVQPQQGGQAHAHAVLHDDEGHDHAQEDDEPHAAFAQLGKVGTEANG